MVPSTSKSSIAPCAPRALRRAPDGRVGLPVAPAGV